MTAGAPAMTPPAGYRYLRHLGAGGFGDVHLAEHVMTGRLVAIKYIQRHLLSDPEVLARFRREAQILAATDVPTVVRVYDLDTSGDPAHLVMEYVPGVTLWDLMEQAPLPAYQGLSVMRDVADALRVMAERGLVHRDIKPSNVFVLPDGRAKLGDFGLARAVADDGGFRTAGAPAGTPAYFPPEVSSGDAEATVESDAYSFAIMVYEVLTGSRPITAPDAISLITAHWTQEPMPLTEAMPGFPASVAPVLMRALAKAPAGRPLPHELMAALDAVPADEWPTNDRPAVPVPDAPPLEQDYEQVAATPTAGLPVETTVAVDVPETFEVTGAAEVAPPARPVAPATVAAAEAPHPPGSGPLRWTPPVQRGPGEAEPDDRDRCRCPRPGRGDVHSHVVAPRGRPGAGAVSRHHRPRGDVGGGGCRPGGCPLPAGDGRADRHHRDQRRRRVAVGGLDAAGRQRRAGTVVRGRRRSARGGGDARHHLHWQQTSGR